jgi:hypothetical protein
MAATPLDLFRAGNKSGPRFDHLRPGEVVIQARKGIDWVVGRSGGASTLEAPIGLGGTWYRLPKGTPYDDSVFYLWNDYPGHWAWEPARDMPLVAFLDALARMNKQFIPAQGVCGITRPR